VKVFLFFSDNRWWRFRQRGFDSSSLRFCNFNNNVFCQDDTSEYGVIFVNNRDFSVSDCIFRSNEGPEFVIWDTLNRGFTLEKCVFSGGLSEDRIVTTAIGNVENPTTEWYSLHWEYSLECSASLCPPIGGSSSSSGWVSNSVSFLGTELNRISEFFQVQKSF
jgi:hypothetical protein